MALSIPTIAIPDLIQNQAYSFEMPEAIGAALIFHFMPEVPLGMSFTIWNKDIRRISNSKTV